MFQSITQIVKNKLFLNDSKRRKMALSCSRRIISIIKRNNIKSNNDFYCLNCLHFFRTKYKLESHKKICKNKDFCNVIMPSGDTKILEFNQYQNLIKHLLLFMQILNV